MFRDPRYAVPFGILVGVIVMAAALLQAQGGAAHSDSSSGTSAQPTADPGETLLDVRRNLDLELLRDALGVYGKRNGSYPATNNLYSTLCARPSDAGCVLSSARSRLPFSDGDLPYWYISDGATYFALAARTFVAGDPAACPPGLPPELAAGPVACVFVQGAP